MSFEYLVDPDFGPQWQGRLPGSPQPYTLRRGEGEHAVLFGDLFTVLVSGDETDGQFGIITSHSPAGDIIPTHAHDRTHETFCVVEGRVRLFYVDGEGRKVSQVLGAGDFGYVPAGVVHAYQVEQAARMLGVLSGGFERFFQHMGQPTDHGEPGQPPFVPEPSRMRAAAEQHEMQFLPGFDWSDAAG